MANKSTQQAKHLVDTNYMGVRDRIQKFQKPMVRRNPKKQSHRI
jgi:hypothetical protein